jgi:hypothetical protein
MKKISVFLLLSALSALSLRADLLFQDSTNYPYTNGCIEGQGQWYAYASKSTTNFLDALVTNNVLYLNATNKDSVGTPTNGWVNPGTVTWASFTINVSQPPVYPNYFVELRDTNGNSVCHVWCTPNGTSVPGTYRLGIGNFGASAHNDYPMDLSTDITYTVVIAYDKEVGSPIEGANLMINPSFTDFNNLMDGLTTGPGIGEGFAYGTDTSTSTNLLNINVSYIGFSPYVGAGISYVMAGTDFTNVVTTNLPVIGIQPQSGTNYSGNPAIFYSVASGVDLQYQWYDSAGALADDGVNIIGSSSNVLTVASVSVSDSYYVIMTDAYGNTLTSATAYETVITTPTPPFFPTNVVAVNYTNNLFTTTTINNTALGTGPLLYQWYFAPSNTPTVFSQISGQNSSTLSLFLGDYSTVGNYYVQVTSSLGSTNGPTNSLTELAPLQASILQLHNLMVAELPQIIANKTGTVPINTNQNVVVSGYVTTYGGFGNPTSGTLPYNEFFIQDTNGYGIEVYLASTGKYQNTNCPPVGTYVTVTGYVEVYSSTLEITPASPAAIQITPAPPFTLQPLLCNAIFNDLATNAYGTNSILRQCSLVTFTNVYFFGKKVPTNPPVATFYSNSYTSFYFVVNGTNFTTNTISGYQYGYNYGAPNTPSYVFNQFNLQPVPTNCYQLTGVLEPYSGSGELLPSRLADYVTNAPVISSSLARTKSVSTLTVNAQPGSTYSIFTSTNLTGAWTPRTYGLGYYPTNVSFIETNKANAAFYRVTSP